MKRGKNKISVQELKKIVKENIRVYKVFCEIFPVLADDKDYELSRQRWTKGLSDNKKLLLWLEEIQINLK